MARKIFLTSALQSFFFISLVPYCIPYALIVHCAKRIYAVFAGVHMEIVQPLATTAIIRRIYKYVYTREGKKFLFSSVLDLAIARYFSLFSLLLSSSSEQRFTSGYSVGTPMCVVISFSCYGITRTLE